MKYTIEQHDGEFYLCRDGVTMGILFINPEATMEQAREMIDAANSREAVGQMLADAQREAKDAYSRGLLAGIPD